MGTFEKSLKMFKTILLTLFCLNCSVLQALLVEDIERDGTTCASLCKDVDFGGNAGICCSNQFCDCSSDSGVPTMCPEGEIFCDLIGDCVHMYEHECVEVGYCCQENGPVPTTAPPTPGPTTTDAFTGTTAEPDETCVRLCEEEGGDLAGYCCFSGYCDCADNTFVTCPQGHYYCKAMGECVEAPSHDCSAIDGCC